MATKVNLVLEDEVKSELDRLVPTGERSRFANEALRDSLATRKRQLAIERLDALRQAGPHVTTEEIVRALREERDGR